MASAPVSLRFAPEHAFVRLRELTGADERAVAGTSTDDALRLLDALLVASPDTPAPPRADDFVAADRDRLLVAVYRDAFGDRIENTLACARCGHPFDLHFSLAELASTLDRGSSHVPQVRAVGAGRFETDDGMRFRLPTGRDERAIAALPAEEAERGLLHRCLLDPSTPPVDAAALEELLAEVAPLIDFELDARCPECQRVHALPFDIQSYLLGALLAERPRLHQEIHRLALAYGWSLNEILSLRRRERRQFVELIDSDTAARWRRFTS